MATMRWQPAWWNEHHASAWERAREALRRDWEQTKHDLNMKGGHELNQSVGDTVKQASGREAIPLDDRPNPPKVVGQLQWEEVELPMGYGYGARDQYRQYASWTPELESELRREWERDARTSRVWPEVRDHVRRGFEAEH
jgi:hypothetical protein